MAKQKEKATANADLPLFDNQVKSIKFLSNASGIDASDPGTGKTRVQIELTRQRLAKNPLSKTLILAPKSILQVAWGDDFEKFAPEITYSIAYASNRAKAFEVDANVYITNTDAVRELAKKNPKFFTNFETIVVDESTAFKNPTAKRTKALFSIAKYFKTRYAMSGSFVTQNELDAWAQVFFVDDGARLGQSYYAFRNKVAEPLRVGMHAQAVKWVIKDKYKDVIPTLFSDICIRHKLEECISIPANFERTVSYVMPPAQQKIYAQVEKEAVAMINNEMLNAVNAASVHTKLLQIASGSVYTEQSKYQTIDSSRYELIADLIEERESVVVFFMWTHQKEILTTLLNKRKITNVLIDGTVSNAKRISAVERFNAGKAKVVLAHPQAAAHGITLTRGTSTIWASPVANLEHFMQGNRRIYRAGQTRKTETIIVTSDAKVEKLTAERLLSKNEMNASVMDILKQASY